MFSIITKAEYFDWLDQGFCSLDRQELKNVQDGFVLSILHSMRDAAIIEAGGGDSRVLSRLHESCEAWNADKLLGEGNGPRSITTNDRVRLVRSYFGDFDPDIPDAYFDILFSVSVVEHIENEKLDAFMDDTIRVLKPGGCALHAVDLNLCDADMIGRPRFANQVAKIDHYRELTEARSNKIEWLEPPRLKAPAIASATYAANSSNTLYRWAKRFPDRRRSREICQSVSLKWGFRKRA